MTPTLFCEPRVMKKAFKIGPRNLFVFPVSFWRTLWLFGSHDKLTSSFTEYSIETNDVQRFQGGYTQSSSRLSRQSDCFLVILIDLIENNSKRPFASFVFMSIIARISTFLNALGMNTHFLHLFSGLKNCYLILFWHPVLIVHVLAWRPPKKIRTSA